MLDKLLALVRWPLMDQRYVTEHVNTDSMVKSGALVVAKAFQEFDDAGRMKPSAYYERIVDVMEELVRFTILTRPHAARLVDRRARLARHNQEEVCRPERFVVTTVAAVNTANMHKSARKHSHRTRRHPGG